MTSEHKFYVVSVLMSITPAIALLVINWIINIIGGPRKYFIYHYEDVMAKVNYYYVRYTYTGIFTVGVTSMDDGYIRFKSPEEAEEHMMKNYYKVPKAKLIKTGTIKDLEQVTTVYTAHE